MSKDQTSNYDQIGTIYDKGEKLVSVRYSVFDAELDGADWIEAVEMQFENIVFTVSVEPDFDTLRVELSEMNVNSDCYIKVATSVKPWDGFIGKRLAWIWLLTNQQGYEDGLRFEFSSKENELKIVTLIGIASSIKLFLSQEINCFRAE
jgi:Family of unknown function (DUF6334)